MKWSPPEAEQIGRFFRALGDPIRPRMLSAMSEGERTVTSLNVAVGSSQENISKHLRVLKESGLVERRREGRWVYYSIANRELQKLLELVCENIFQPS